MTAILLVDDSVMERKLVAGALHKALECSVTEADSGESALEQLETFEPDVVLTDLMMPGINGLELVERIRDEWPGLPVVLMTARGSEEIAAQALKVGAASYVPKKRLSEDLAPTVLRIVSGAQQEKTHSRLMHHLSRGQLTFEIRNDIALVPPLIRTIQEMLRSLPLQDEAERLRVGVAVEEAIRNAMFHGNLELNSPPTLTQSRDELAARRLGIPPYCNRQVSIDIQISREQAVFTIRSEGPGFDASPFEGDEFDSDAPHGRGIHLLRTFMDSVEFNDNGREVLLRKNHHVDNEMDDLDESEE